jgi:hypothetical protein
VPNWKNKLNLYKAENIMLGVYNPFDFTARFKGKPFFMAYADGGYSPELLQKFYDDISVDDKELLIGEDATHFADTGSSDLDLVDHSCWGSVGTHTLKQGSQDARDGRGRARRPGIRPGLR